MKKLLTRTLSFMASVAMILSLSTVASAASDSPFLRHYLPTRLRGSNSTIESEEMTP